MKIILINPPFNIVKENYDSSVSVGLLCIASYLRQKGIEVKMIDGARQKNYLELLDKEISDSDHIGLSVMTTQIPKALEISKYAKEKNKNIKVIWGGSHPTFFIKQTAEHPLVDIVNFGEGEETIFEIMSRKPFEDIKGIAYKKNGEVIVNAQRPLIDPAQSPAINWDLAPREVLEKLYLIPSLTSRGCPHQCTFCINAILKNRWRPRTAEEVIGDLKDIKSKPYFAGKKMRFWDENFFVDINRAKKIIDGMLENNITIPWETTVRANYFKAGMIDQELLAKMKSSGCYLLSFGAESGSMEILKKIKKGITPDEVLNSAKMCLGAGITPQYSFMIGLPGETKKDMFKTLKLIDQLVALSDDIQILGPQAFRPYPGSPLYAECVAAGWKDPDSLEEWSELIKNELSYLTVQNFPWVKYKDFVESMEAYVRFGALPIKSALGSSVKANRMIKLGFVLLCKLRWKLKFFFWPLEFKLAKRFVTK